jgi:UDP-galactopyranose mutase
MIKGSIPWRRGVTIIKHYTLFVQANRQLNHPVEIIERKNSILPKSWFAYTRNASAKNLASRRCACNMSVFLPGIIDELYTYIIFGPNHLNRRTVGLSKSVARTQQYAVWCTISFRQKVEQVVRIQRPSCFGQTNTRTYISQAKNAMMKRWSN